MRELDNIDTIVVHHSDSDVPAHDDIRVIDEWHKARGFIFHSGGLTRHIGYHYFIKSDGVIQLGRPLHIEGAHVLGHNRGTIGICLHGRSGASVFQLKALSRLVESLRVALGWLAVMGHCELDIENKPGCPGYDVMSYIDEHLRQ